LNRTVKVTARPVRFRLESGRLVSVLVEWDFIQDD